MGNGCQGFAQEADPGANAPRLGEDGPFGRLRGWHAVWLLAQGWTASATAEALERDPHTIGTLRQAQEGA